MPRVGYLLRMYPRFSQTFVVNEILELENQGLPLSILSLRKPDEGIFHEMVCRVQARAHYVPETVLDTIRRKPAVAWRILRKSPIDSAKALGVILRYAGATRIDLAQAISTVRWARKQRIKHLHVHFGTNEATVALLTNLLGGPTYSLTLHAFDIFRDNVDRMLLARKINGSRFTITVSEFNKRYLVKNFPEVDSSRVRVNYNGIDHRYFSERDDTGEKRSVLTVGRLIEKKGFSHLVHAAAKLHDAGRPITCKIVGDGPERSKLQKLIDQHGLSTHVELCGPLRQEQVRSLMRTCACFVLPCVKAKDGNMDALPTVLLESLASGCPSVSTRLSGIPEIIEDRVSGLLVEPGDDTCLAEAIDEIIQNPGLARELADGGRRRVMQRFDIQKNVERMRNWLTEDQTRKPASNTACETSLEPEMAFVPSLQEGPS